MHFFKEILISCHLCVSDDRTLSREETDGSEFLLKGKLLFTTSVEKYLLLSFRRNESEQKYFGLDLIELVVTTVNVQ